jgi:hypothetical protein
MCAADTNKEWFNKNEKHHRDNDLQVICYDNGAKKCYVNGKLHSDNDLPAIVRLSGTKEWYINGKFHRLGGLPAIKYKKWN